MRVKIKYFIVIKKQKGDSLSFYDKKPPLFYYLGKKYGQYPGVCSKAGLFVNVFLSIGHNKR